MVKGARLVRNATRPRGAAETGGFGGWALRARVASPNGPRVSAAKPRTGAHPVKLDPDKFGDEAARPNRWLD